MPPYEVTIDELRTCVDPLNGAMWKCDAIQVAEVKTAIEAGNVDKRSWSEVKDTLDPAHHRAFHVARIAFLASKSAEADDPHKIMIAIAPDRVWIYDGNHRIAAAIVRGDVAMRVWIAPYEEAAISERFPSAKAVEISN